MSIPVSAGSYNGLSWGGPTDALRVAAATGFQDLPQLRRRATPHSQVDGAARSRFLLDEHILQLTLHAVPVTGITVDQTIRAVIAAAPRTPDFPLPLIFDSSTKRATAFVVNRSITPGAKSTYAKVVLQWELSDPKIYSDPATTITTVIGATISTSNAGNDKAGWIATIAGACVNPTIALGGSVIKIPTTMSGGDVLIVDAYQLTVTKNGTRISETMASDWWLLNPGSNSVVLGADSGTPAVTFVYRSAWA